MVEVIRPHFRTPHDSGLGRRPVVFDIIAPDGTTSLLPDNLKMILYANPKELSFQYSKKNSITQTMSGWVEYYWGDEPITITLNIPTGGFVRIGTGISAITGPVSSKGQSYGLNTGGTRRDTIQYDKMLDLLALFHNNGSVYDRAGNIALQGRIKMSFDGGIWLGWFQSFSVEETSESPFQFQLSAVLQIEREIRGVRTQGGYYR